MTHLFILHLSLTPGISFYDLAFYYVSVAQTMAAAMPGYIILGVQSINAR